MAQSAKHRARELGREAGRAAATWYFDGNTSDATYAKVRAGIDAGDPEVEDTFKIPDLSGEWAGDPTPDRLMAEIYAHPERNRASEDDVCQAWEEGAYEGYMAEIERTLKAMIG